MSETCRCGADLLEGRCIAYCLPIPRRHLLRRLWALPGWICCGCGLFVPEAEIANSRYWMKGDLLAALYEAHKKAVNCGR